jgi:hypothetical protein
MVKYLLIYSISAMDRKKDIKILRRLVIYQQDQVETAIIIQNLIKGLMV